MGNNGFHYYLLFTSPTCRCGAWPDTKQSAGPGLPARVCGCVRLVAGRDGETGICCPGVRRGSRACPPPLAMPGMDSDLQQAGGQGSGRGPRTASTQRLGLYHRPAAPGAGGLHPLSDRRGVAQAGDRAAAVASLAKVPPFVPEIGGGQTNQI